MARQSSHSSSIPSSPSKAPVSTWEAAFLASSRRLAAKPKSVPRIAEKPRRKPLSSTSPSTHREGPRTESAPTTSIEMVLPLPPTESEQQRKDNKEVFGSILSYLEKSGGLPEIGVVNQPLPLEEDMGCRGGRRGTKQPEKEVEKGIDEQRAEEDEVSRKEKEKKEKRRSERRQRKREDKRLRKEEEWRKRAESPDFKEESTTARVKVGMLAQFGPSTQQKTSWPHSRLVASEAQLRGSNDKEDPDISPLMQRRKGPQKTQQ
ncbi:ensconsin-like [Benincasa hispida]|uniref:ensconsin-like n=1 Tax=Benincasa hispida TaxID=102211 RepID=UPI0018FF8E92|nr:ensconsin-like [Benincasa hispida]